MKQLKVPQTIKDLKEKAYDLFYKGKVQEAYKVIEEEMIPQAKELKDEYAQIYSYLVIGRLKMEIGQYNHADDFLLEAQSILKVKEEEVKAGSDYTLTLLDCKWRHIQVKNYTRGHYYQKAEDLLNDSLAVLDKLQGQEKLKQKYLAKMYEHQCNLYCEPLCFRKAEEYLLKAETIYKNENLKLKQDYQIKFQIKYAAFKKKYGFFDDAASYLENFDKELMIIEKQLDAKQYQKYQYKCYRDLARIYALKRNKTLSINYHQKAQALFKKIYPNVQNNIKSAKLQFIKGIWTGKFDVDQAIDELGKAFNQFAQVCGSENNHFGACCLLEIGNFNTRLKDFESATAFLDHAGQIFNEIFPLGHPIHQKTLAYQAEIASNAEDKEMMTQITDDLVEIVDSTNKKENGDKSVYLLDALLTKISILCQATGKEEELDKCIAEMEQIASLNGIEDESHLVHSAYTMKSIELIRKGENNKALQLLEMTYAKQLINLKGAKVHPFLEQLQSQMGMLLKGMAQYDRAEEVYQNLINTKEKYYGTEFEGVLTPMKHLGQTLFLKGKKDEAMAMFEKAVNLGNQIMSKKPQKDRKNILPLLQDLHFTKYSILVSSNDYFGALSEVDKYIDVSKELHGERSSQYSYSIFLKAKLMVLIPNSNQQEIRQLVDQAIKIEEELQYNKPVKSALLGRIYYVKATSEFGERNFKEARKAYKRAQEILRAYQEFNEMEQELNMQIYACEQQGAESDDEEVNDSQSKTDSGNIPPVVVGGIAALAVGALVFGFMKFRQN